MNEDLELLSAYQDEYPKLVAACVKVLETTPKALDNASPSHNAALTALLEMAAALESGRDAIREALKK